MSGDPDERRGQVFRLRPATRGASVIALLVANSLALASLLIMLSSGLALIY